MDLNDGICIRSNGISVWYVFVLFEWYISMICIRLIMIHKMVWNQFCTLEMSVLELIWVLCQPIEWGSIVEQQRWHPICQSNTVAIGLRGELAEWVMSYEKCDICNVISSEDNASKCLATVCRKVVFHNETILNDVSPRMNSERGIIDARDTVWHWEVPSYLLERVTIEWDMLTHTGLVLLDPVIFRSALDQASMTIVKRLDSGFRCLLVMLRLTESAVWSRADLWYAMSSDLSMTYDADFVQYDLDCWNTNASLAVLLPLLQSEFETPLSFQLAAEMSVPEYGISCVIFVMTLEQTTVWTLYCEKNPIASGWRYVVPLMRFVVRVKIVQYMLTSTCLVCHPCWNYNAIQIIRMISCPRMYKGVRQVLMSRVGNEYRFDEKRTASVIDIEQVTILSVQLGSRGAVSHWYTVYEKMWRTKSADHRIETYTFIVSDEWCISSATVNEDISQVR